MIMVLQLSACNIMGLLSSVCFELVLSFLLEGVFYRWGFAVVLCISERNIGHLRKDPPGIKTPRP